MNNRLQNHNMTGDISNFTDVQSSSSVSTQKRFRTNPSFNKTNFSTPRKAGCGLNYKKTNRYLTIFDRGVTSVTVSRHKIDDSHLYDRNKTKNPQPQKLNTYQAKHPHCSMTQGYNDQGTSKLMVRNHISAVTARYITPSRTNGNMLAPFQTKCYSEATQINHIDTGNTISSSFNPVSFNISSYYPNIQFTPDDFEYLEQLGKGEFGTVYKVKLKSGGDPKYYCIKQIHKSRTKAETTFKKEVALHKRIIHPHIVEMYGYFEDNVSANLVMEACLIGDLFRILQESKLNITSSSRQHGISYQEAALYISQIADALNYLHMNHIYHRDVKPENILVTVPPSASPCYIQQHPYYKHLKLCDFGLAICAPNSNLLSPFDVCNSYDDTVWRRSLCGTPDYIPPEMVNYTPVQNEKNEDYYRMKIRKSCTYDVRYVDVWALGITAYELVVGHTPTFLPPDDKKRIMKEMGYRDHNEPTYDRIRAIKDFVHVDIVRKDDYASSYFNYRPTLQEELFCNFIACVTQTTPNKRITIGEVLNHEWITHNLRNL